MPNTSVQTQSASGIQNTLCYGFRNVEMVEHCCTVP